MLCVISPAKRLDEEPRALPAGLEPTEPSFGADAAKLAKIARGLSVADLRALMGISEPLARLNAERFAAFRAKPAAGAVKPAAFCFDGDTYAGLEAKTLDADALRWAQGHLRILSGLYGLLRPLDLIQPYRLEMGSRLANPKGPDLYAWWGNRIARALNAQGAEVGAEVLVNCASQEYFGAVDLRALKLRVVTPVFLEGRGAEAKVVSFFAKKARGAMARFIAENRLTDPADILGFSTGGYALDAERSTPDRPVFLREAGAEAAA
ncbi:peroxide stress protein YaaA [Rhodobacteraceae bacterium HSP-20]|uniref:UPF0246 protein GU927_014975 n=1 Tax=Paragemmobacter amnigenus TaxID=2852097 RepID=A0ABS6J6I4_9RHOB|nr:peroxide stress protein YaaA [Rhodobacter amnigenus]MBU9699152.1 peroxide stress protein YaaA [Rhodobacter amnigenus]MBV4390379.1 peroxide stress protein YaaA [Rhodobacter amnigenus]